MITSFSYHYYIIITTLSDYVTILQDHYQLLMISKWCNGCVKLK